MTKKKKSLPSLKTLKKCITKVYIDLMDKIIWSVWYFFVFLEVTASFADDFVTYADSIGLTYFHLEIGNALSSDLTENITLAFVGMILLFNAASKGQVNILPKYARFHLFHAVLLTGIFQGLGELYMAILRMELPDETFEPFASIYIPLVATLYVTTMAQSFGSIIRSNREKKVFPQTPATGAAIMQVASSSLKR
jgi:hypothetical protein